MDIRIEEVQTTIDTVDGDALLSPEIMERIVRQVMAALERQRISEKRSDDDRDLRSIVDQQRAGKR